MEMLTHLAKVENAPMVTMADGAMLISMPVTRGINTMESSSPQLPAEQEQTLISPVFAMENQIFLVLVGLVKMVAISAMLIKMPTVQISHSTMENLHPDMLVKVTMVSYIYY